MIVIVSIEHIGVRLFAFCINSCRMDYFCGRQSVVVNPRRRVNDIYLRRGGYVSVVGCVYLCAEKTTVLHKIFGGVGVARE